MKKFKFNERNLISNNENFILNENNENYKSYNTCQNIYQNPLKILPTSKYPNKNLDSSYKTDIQKNSDNNLELTLREYESMILNNTFPNQILQQNNLYNEIPDKNMIKNNSTNNLKEEIIKEYKSLSYDNDEQLNELAINIKENKDQIDLINKKINLIANKKNDQEIIDTKNFFLQADDMEKIKQENITLKADSIIYREDISNLVQSNDKLTQDLENARKKIMELIEKNNEIEKEINHKENQIGKLNEILIRLRLYENQDYEFKIKNDKPNEEVLNEIENNVKIGKEENNKLIQDKKNLEDKIQNLIQKRIDFNKNHLFNNEKENKIINELEEKIKFFENNIINLSEQNNMLALTNSKMEEELNNLYIDRNSYEEKYNKEKEDFKKLRSCYNNLYNKYQNVFIENNQKLMKKEMIRRNKSEKKMQKNKNVINELYNKIQNLKSKVKNDRNFVN